MPSPWLVYLLRGLLLKKFQHTNFLQITFYIVIYVYILLLLLLLDEICKIEILENKTWIWMVVVAQCGISFIVLS